MRQQKKGSVAIIQMKSREKKLNYEKTFSILRNKSKSSFRYVGGTRGLKLFKVRMLKFQILERCQRTPRKVHVKKIMSICRESLEVTVKLLKTKGKEKILNQERKTTHCTTPGLHKPTNLLIS